ncbi:ANTH domain-containing protein [Russula earlei]|uniref:ANTH domain-containing protein n=1 Tax=Russula earlei TaxID=71964 RepID=A0ACC0U0U4_9AGAM|nr:ANTH domain-containing protein [Russula earlei]
MSSFEKVVKNACKPKPTPPKSKYIDPIVAATWSEDGAIHDVCKALSPRFREPNSIVVFKALIVLHTMIRNGATDNVLQYLASSGVLRLQNVGASQWEGFDAPTNLQHYAMYLDSRIRAYRELKHDAIRVQSETNRDLRISMSLGEEDPRVDRRYPPEENPDDFEPSGSAARRKTIMGRKLRVMTVEKGLLRETKVVQNMMDSLVECRFYLDDMEDQLTLTALRMLVKDLLILFQAVNEGVINVLEHYFEMSHVDAKTALAIYRHFCKQAEYAVEYLGVAKKLQNLLNVPIPSLKHAPVSLAGALEEYLNDPNFEQNRIEYKANKDAADRNMKNVSSVPTVTFPDVAPSKETPNAEPPKALTDFFSVIETEPTTVFTPQPESLASAQVQPATYNPFHPLGIFGSSTNPFPQTQAQPQSAGFLQPQITAVPGVVQPPSNPFPGLQTAPPNFLPPQITGANPFRASIFPSQATGLSPFNQSKSLPAPTGHNPFSSQSGFLGTNPFPTTFSNTNPFPIAEQTTNPFPAVVNVNPFAALVNNPVSNATGPIQSFPSMNSDAFHTQSHTNTFVPARPASTPLTQLKSASPPPRPLKSHQTGSRNPFGIPKAPSPPPVPRAPTLFELANGVVQPQQQSESTVQVKSQPTGLPTSTFTSVASSFITRTGGAQVSQPTTSPLTSLGSSSIAPSTPTSLTATSSASLFSSAGEQPSGNTVHSSQPTGPSLRPQTTGFNAGIKAFKPTSSFGASLLEALPPIPQSAPTTPSHDAASVGLGPSLSIVSSATTNGGTAIGGSLGLTAQPTGFPINGAGPSGLTPFVGIGLRPQATGGGLGAANPFRASVMPSGLGTSIGVLPAFSAVNANAANGPFSQPTNAPPFGQSWFVGAEADMSKRQNTAAPLI